MASKKTKTVYGEEVFGQPTVLQAMIDAYYVYVDNLPIEHVQVGKNVYEREVPYTVEGLCAWLRVQKSDVKRLLTDPGANAEAKRIMVNAITFIEARLTEKALLGKLDATVSKIVLAGSLLSGADAEIESANGLTIRISGMTAKDVEEAQR